MPAYMIAEMDVTDDGAYEQYKAAAGNVIAAYGGRYLARGGRTLLLEGRAPTRVVVVEFDTLEAAERWYRSPDYQDARKLREGAAAGRLFVIEAAE